MEAIGHIIPIAVAVAVSSVPIMATILILLSPNRARAALPFLIGWVIGILLVVTVFTLVAQVVPTARTQRQPDTAVAVLETLVGVVIVALSVISFRRSRHHPEPAMPDPLKARRSLGPWEAFGLAFVLNLRPKALLLAIAAGLSIRADASSTSDALISIAIYTVIGASSVAVPIIATLAAPKKMEPKLVDAREWLTRNGGLLTSLILFFIGIVVIGMGIARF
ncbi:GAP family protein [Microbacterium sp. CFBP9034]|uniref:GAP family protein n=1 Tax=Microbacterium sp. CFBP9034 TaxID=3096540 RepID=UPI002A6AFA1D|nr:GAP family protein [Microbacterium sp. CFBP9034]MDY0910444.1 GAP family protein [Microbacterium sp. CFBP9034]